VAGLLQGGWARKSQKRGVRTVFFNRKWTDERLDQLLRDVEQTKRDFQQLLQEWDATSSRVTKVLRRIRSAEAAQEKQEEPAAEVAARLDAGKPATLPTSPGRMERIKAQLTARNGG